MKFVVVIFLIIYGEILEMTKIVITRSKFFLSNDKPRFVVNVNPPTVIVDQ